MIENLPMLSGVEIRLLCSASAERAAAFCRLLGTDEQKSWIESGLEVAWRMSAGIDAADECSSLLDHIVDDDDEDEFDDADPTAQPAFYADQAVGLVGEALAASLAPSEDRVAAGHKTIRALLAMVDFKLSGEKPVIVRSGESRPGPGPLVRREKEAQDHAVAILLRERGVGGEQQGLSYTLAELRDLARVFAAEVTPSLEEFSEASDWI